LERRVIASMTGFASARSKLATGEVLIELRSVNHRHLELHFKLPDDLRALEPEFRAQIGQSLKRGKVDIAVRVRNPHGGSSAIEIDEEVLDQLFEQAEHQWPDMDLGSLGQWLAIPGVLRVTEVDDEELKPAVMSAFTEALASLKATREREGAELKRVLLDRVATFEDVLNSLRALLPELKAQVIDKIRQRLSEVGLEVDGARFEQELVLALQRNDVDEELARLDLHVIELKRLLNGREPVGRRLDFLLQELNREANTLGAKAADIRSTNVAIDLKVLLEQIREQVQNLE
jgi:uncharacterized protein (TIGR00255 family)